MGSWGMVTQNQGFCNQKRPILIGSELVFNNPVVVINNLITAEPKMENAPNAIKKAKKLSKKQQKHMDALRAKCLAKREEMAPEQRAKMEKARLKMERSRQRRAAAAAMAEADERTAAGTSQPPVREPRMTKKHSLRDDPCYDYEADRYCIGARTKQTGRKHSGKKPKALHLTDMDMDAEDIRHLDEMDYCSSSSEEVIVPKKPPKKKELTLDEKIKKAETSELYGTWMNEMDPSLVHVCQIAIAKLELRLLKKQRNAMSAPVREQLKQQHDRLVEARDNALLNRYKKGKEESKVIEKRSLSPSGL